VQDSADIDYTRSIAAQLRLLVGAGLEQAVRLAQGDPIEPSRKIPELANNAGINATASSHENARSGPRGHARLSGTKHEAFSIAGDQSDGEEVPASARHCWTSKVAATASS